MVFITQSYFAVLIDVRLNTTHFFIIKIPKKQDIQQITVIIFLMLTRSAAKISALSSGKVDKYGYLLGEDILPPRIKQGAKFTYSTLGKAFEKQTKTIEEQGKESRGFTVFGSF